MTVYHVLVPRAGTPPARWIRGGSGVVSTLEPSRAPSAGGGVEVYFEGNLYGAQLQSFEDKVMHAAGRLREQYPTVARGVWPADCFDVVGTYTFDDPAGVALRVTDEPRVQQWTCLQFEEQPGEPPVDVCPDCGTVRE